MIRVLAACVATAVLTLTLTLTLTLQGGMGRLAAVAASEDFVPHCPQPRYAANGNFGPLFCLVDNPAAIKAFAPSARHTFALGPDATPSQVSAALVSDYKHGGTVPILCSIYKLAVWRNHWRFAVPASAQVGAELDLPSGWCSEPSISDAS